MQSVYQHVLIERSISKTSVKRLKGQRQMKTLSKPGICQICGDEARIINYGALSCQPCKTFFRRNGCHPERVPPCLYDGVCNITKETRRSCPSCRLAKCLKEGMSSDLIRKEETKTKRCSSTAKHNDNNNFTVDTFAKSTIQVRISEQSHFTEYLLFDYQKKILFNVHHALDMNSVILKIRGVIDDELAVLLGLPFDRSAASQCIDYIYSSIRSFINCIPDFQILVLDEQSSLFRRNFNGVVNLYSALIFRHTGIMNQPDLIRTFTSIYGQQMMFKLIRISKQLNVDLISIKLLLLILTFSSNCSMINYQPKIHHDSLLTGMFRLLGSQNVYVVVLWKHMVCQYGYYKAACHFSRLIQFTLNLITSSAMTYMNNEIYHQLVDEFNQTTQQMLIDNRQEQVRLWGII